MAAQKALIFSLAYYPHLIGGAEVAVKEITDRIDPSDIEFHMITMKNDPFLPQTEKIGNVTLHRIGFAAESGILFALNKYVYLVLAPFKASCLHRMHKFDFTWAIMAYVAGFPALFFKMFHMNVPFLLTLQEGDSIDYILRKTRLVGKLFRNIFRNADGIQAISTYLADFASDMGARKKPVVVPNGVDVERFSRFVVGAELEAIKHEINKETGDVMLVTASRLVAKNAVGDIIGALAYLPANVKLLVLGSGPLEADLKEQATDLSVADRVIFKGFVPHELLSGYLQASDVFVRPSLSEGFGNSFVEAMAAGVPVIATRAGGIVDFLRDKETGLFCDMHSPQDIARKVQIYMQDKNLRAEIVDNAMHMVVDRYDWKTIARDMREKAFGPVMMRP
ncbi:MAG TPA: glycosyltransferase family 4 protein [Candidatus Paceibacterota bacterium]|nr:glycosyltransferase family 4 protein [Candidatus Paceibacterota bacterium]